MGYSIVWEKQGAVCVYSGALTLDELAASMSSVHQHADFHQFQFAIHDFTGAAELRPGEIDLSTLIAEVLVASRTNPTMKTAIIAMHPRIVQVAQKYASAAALDSQIFPNRQAARNWLRECHPTLIPPRE
jgi:hypothetical protein